VVFLGAIGMGNRDGLVGSSTSVRDLLVAAVVLVSVHCCVFWLGISMLPILMYHVMQLVIGSLLVDRIRSQQVAGEGASVDSQVSEG